MELVDDQPVFQPMDLDPDYNAVLPATYFEADGTRHAYLVGFGQARGDQKVFHVTSTDGVDWTVDTDDPFAGLGLDLSPPGPIPGSVLATGDGTWLMYLWGVPSPRMEGSSIWRATATGPGEPWTADPEPVLEPNTLGQWDDRGLDFPAVLAAGSGYEMLYSANGRSNSESSAIGRATSADGIAWQRDAANPVVTHELCGDAIPQASLPRVVTEQGRPTVLVWLAGQTMRLATSPDGVTWTCGSGDPILTKDDLPNSEGIHTVAAGLVGGEVSVLVESLIDRDGVVGSELFLARAVPAAAPTAREVEIGPLVPGTYTMAEFQPHVEVTVASAGWQTFHHEPNFWDVVRPDGDGVLGLLMQSPTAVYGATGAVPTTTAEQAVSLLGQKPGATVSEPVPATLDGVSGLAVDVQADRDDTHLLAANRELLGIGPGEDVRLAFFAVSGRLLAIGTLAPHGRLNEAAAAVEPLLASVKIGR